MFIDSKSYSLPKCNFIEEKTLKTKIVIGNTFNHDMRHYIGWRNRYNGNYKKTAHFTISTNGSVYEHFDTDYYSQYFKDKVLSESSIVILLENDGWLTKNNKTDEFINWIGDIYNDKSQVVEQKWRKEKYWGAYSKEQMVSIIKLLKFLCRKHNIPPTIYDHNTKVDSIINYRGILYKSNIEKYYSDVTPAWDFKYLKQKIEKI